MISVRSSYTEITKAIKSLNLVTYKDMRGMGHLHLINALIM